MTHTRVTADRAVQTAPRKGVRLAAAGGLLGAVAASSCCILPLVLFSLGVSGVWIGALTDLAPYTPVFVAVSAGFLGYGYWSVYRPARACGKGGACGSAGSRRLVKGTLWIATALAGLAVAWPYLVPFVLG